MELGKLIRAQLDRGLALAGGAVAALILIVGWFGVSRTPFPAEQIPYVVSAGIGGVFLLGVAATVWLSADLRDEWRKLDSIDEALRDLRGTPLVPTAGPAEADLTNPAAGGAPAVGGAKRTPTKLEASR